MDIAANAATSALNPTIAPVSPQCLRIMPALGMQAILVLVWRGLSSREGKCRFGKPSEDTFRNPSMRSSSTFRFPQILGERRRIWGFDIHCRDWRFKASRNTRMTALLRGAVSSGSSRTPIIDYRCSSTVTRFRLLATVPYNNLKT